ncbi:23S rRNA Um-2552 2'-O-methyltransferase [Methanothermus fervidus DSM 2088]|uniref:Ribosomal RNA large subunit methyltransferase E n=1 Tax=Methanothermus fervidus (strain ATCC 43054 / DSM 2088 / JCM 10308 / V24 S) TaxID=523846 RepID=E3GY92_METFV|nr:SAM-dependent methyltransferase [Methanothermus fervidus]ADP77274.1 23S rRNA Um-2552 2'-O-methyltransferase [Methanothermus fervidus DSM 2088]
MGKRWWRQRKKDYYYRLAKKEKYYSRAAYKLIQLNKKFKLIRRGNVVLDLGAAPGGWSQVAIKLVGSKGKVVAVDIKKMKPLKYENFSFIQGDFTDPKIQKKIKEITEGGVDVIISDASPSLSGIKDLDHIRSIELCKSVINIAKNVLKRGGNLVVKVFQGPEFKNLLDELKNEFKYVKASKPPSSEKSSAEIYVVAKYFVGP